MPRQRGSELSKEIMTLRRSLTSLHHPLRYLAAKLRQLDGSFEGRRRPHAGSSKPLSAKTRASLALQGRYMGFMRQLRPKQKAQVRKVREAKGVRVAIARAKVLARA